MSLLDADADKKAAKALSSDGRRKFLEDLAFWLTLNARGYYQPTEDIPALRGLECHNEMIHVIAKQLRSDEAVDDSTGYPDEALLQVLRSEAKARGFESSYQGAIEKALRAD